MKIIVIGSKAYRWFFTSKNLLFKLHLSFLGSKPKSHIPSLCSWERLLWRAVQLDQTENRPGGPHHSLLFTSQALTPTPGADALLSIPDFLLCSSLPTETSNSTVSSAARDEELAKVFDHFDTNKDGKISADELQAYFMSIGESMSIGEAQSVIKELDNDGDNLLEYEDFVSLMRREDIDANGNDDLKKAFEMFQVDKGCGCITPKGLQNMFNRLGDTKSYDECVSMIGVFDLDGNGVLDFQEFLKMMSST